MSIFPIESFYFSFFSLDKSNAFILNILKRKSWKDKFICENMNIVSMSRDQDKKMETAGNKKVN